MFPAGAAGDYTFANAVALYNPAYLIARAAQDVPLHRGDHLLGAGPARSIGYEQWRLGAAERGWMSVSDAV